jgi:nucleotidyltransferase-like protein/aminoglycoside adenylyltransferase-like protein
MLPPHASEHLHKFLAGVDHLLPNAYVWLEGSLALADYRPGLSDIDVVVVAERPAPELARRPLQITWLAPTALADLAAEPLGAVRAATLHRHGIPLRGPHPSRFVADVPHATLAQAMAHNLRTYWQPWLARSRSNLVQRLVALHPRRIAWGVFGVPRMLVTLGDGRIVSKTEGALDLRARVDKRWHRIIDEALRIRQHRRRSLYLSPFARRRDMLDFVQYAIELAGVAQAG